MVAVVASPRLGWPFLLLLVLVAATNVSSDCVPEFGKCVMNRDCCAGSECMAGDWAVTTDSTCLSKRSQSLNGLAEPDRIALITRYYQRVLPPDEDKKKAPGEVEKLVAKYERKFAQLVLRLEEKYQASMQEEGETTAAAQSSSEEL
jgi:hypothetical protein